MKVKPLHDYVLVLRDKREEKKSPAGIVIPVKAQEKIQNTAVVLEVGHGRVLPDGSIVKPSVVPGDRVLIGEFGGVDITWGDNENGTMIAWNDVLGIVVES